MKKMRLLAMALVGALLTACSGGGDSNGSIPGDPLDVKKVCNIDNFDNVTFSYEVVFKDEEQVHSSVAKITKDKGSVILENGDERVVSSKDIGAIKDIYIQLSLNAVNSAHQKGCVKNGEEYICNETFTLDVEVPIDTIMVKADLSVSNMIIRLNDSGLIEELEFDMVQKYDKELFDDEGELSLHGVFRFSDYGKTVITAE